MSWHWLFGNLTIKDLAFLHNPIIAPAFGMMILAAVTVPLVLTYKRKWTWLWSEWITTIDHKKIGVMYLILAFIMLLRGFSDALLMRSQQAIASGNMGYLPPHHYNEIFTAHGVIMIFFMAMPLMFGLWNLVVPIQIGARDVAFPYLNSLSFWLTVIGAMLVNISLGIGEFAATGWLAYPPLSGIVYSPGVGVDYYIWALQISGIGTLLAGINFIATIVKMRCPGMTFFRLPIFVWTVLSASILIVMVFPVLTVTLGLLFLDRFFDMHFFTMGMGGNAMMYINLIWIWGHPEVYILILPAFGVFSEVVATFCKKRLFGYNMMVWATLAICFMSFIVWLHHFFTMGSGANVNAFFGIATMIIAIPTGVKVFNWLFTMYRGKIHFYTPMIYAVAFISTFAVGGMTGVLMSVPAVDFQLHNSLFLVAHFHNVIVGGVIFGYFAGFIYWFPKIFGFKLNERLGKISCTCWVVGFYVAFMPLYILGLMGMTRRMSHYPADTGWQPFLIVAAIGSLLVAAGIFFQFVQIVYSVINRHKPEHACDSDPWDGRTLEWSIPSPAPFYNFAVTPTVSDIDEFWEVKQRIKAGEKIAKPTIKAIHMPKNTGIGFVIALMSGAIGFGMIWEMYWLVILGVVGVLAAWIIRSFDTDVDYYVQPAEIRKIENQALPEGKV
jgi:cytochrome o ubiquinol oxidase subunit 1